MLGYYLDNVRFHESPEKTAQSAVRGANPNVETPPGTAAGAFLQWRQQMY